MNETMEQRYHSKKALRVIAKVAIVAVCFLAYVHVFSLTTKFSLKGQLRALMADNNEESVVETNKNHKKPKIAIISSFVPSSQYKNSTRVKDLDHLINKACYSYLWGYDFIFNMTFGFDPELVNKGKYWLDYGTWSRVPHIRDRIDDYDWILYADTDYVIHDFTTPLESIFASWKFYNRTPSLLFPRDMKLNHIYAFSAFALLVKNSDFGKGLLDNWMQFAHGICEKGNMSPEKRPYTWEDSDQPGLWYAIVKTHTDFFHKYKLDKPICNNETGTVDTKRAFGPELNSYCARIGAKYGAFGEDLKDVPNDQPFLWSKPPPEGRPGMGDFGVQLKFGVKPEDVEKTVKSAFAFHESRLNLWPAKAHETLDICKRVHGCYAEYREDGMLHIGCQDTEYDVAVHGVVDKGGVPRKGKVSRSPGKGPHEEFALSNS